MKTITINLFDICELSEQAQQNAHNEYLKHIEYHWFDENINSVRSLLAVFGASVTDYSLDTHSYSYIKTDISQENIRGVSLKDVRDIDTDGYWLSEVLKSNLIDSIKESDGDVLNAVRGTMVIAVSLIVNDMSEQESFDYFKEHSQANNWVYLENGSIWFE